MQRSTCIVNSFLWWCLRLIIRLLPVQTFGNSFSDPFLEVQCPVGPCLQGLGRHPGIIRLWSGWAKLWWTSWERTFIFFSAWNRSSKRDSHVTSEERWYCIVQTRVVIPLKTHRGCQGCTCIDSSGSQSRPTCFLPYGTWTWEELHSVPLGQVTLLCHHRFCAVLGWNSEVLEKAEVRSLA